MQDLNAGSMWIQVSPELVVNLRSFQRIASASTIVHHHYLIGAAPLNQEI